MLDGSRHFARLPKISPWEVVRGHTLLLQGAEVVNFVDNDMAPAWLDFTYRGYRFLIHSHENQLHLFVHDPQCSDLLLYQVGSHFERLAEGG